MKLEYYGWDDGTSLYHYGIPGQKRGVRRFQNPDGTLTEEGKKRYGQLRDSVRNYREKRLTYYSNRADALENDYKNRMKASGGRYEYTGRAIDQRREIKNSQRMTKHLMKRYGKKYNMSYNVATGRYTLSDK